MSDRPGDAPNRLAEESSPYLLLHRHNPVDWYPWGPEALNRAREENRPIFLSVGYSTCYWCHVMERESFSDPRVAAAMNRSFVNIKVDREERPDLDEIYMAATQILTGQGGWPNSLFLTPDLKPFYAGTYFPPVEAHGRPSFASVVADLAAAWTERRQEISEQAEEMAAAMSRFLEGHPPAAEELPAPDSMRRAFESLGQRFDREFGGFGAAPKFPTPANLFLLAEVAPTEPDAAEMLRLTLDAMARGGIYDQIGGGFHRYSTDRTWTVPHFEKMLYDNGLLLEVYAEQAARTGDSETFRIVRETAAFLQRELTAPEGGFWSAIDAETDGHEGAYYVWTPEQIEKVLKPEDAVFLAPLLGYEGHPTFEDHAYVLRLPEPLATAAAKRHLDPAALRGEIEQLSARLLSARWERPRPATDDKLLVDWNGTAITGLATAGRALRSPELVTHAARAADFLLENLRPAGTLCHTWRAGSARIPAYLSDYVHLIRGLLALHRATGEQRWLGAAEELTEEQVSRLRAPDGGFFGAAAAPDLLFRSQDPFDGALPSPNSLAVLNLLELASRTGKSSYREEAAAALRAFAPLLSAHPEALRMMSIAAHRFAAGKEAPTHAQEQREPGEHRADGEPVVTARLRLVPAAEWQPFTVELSIATGWHLQAVPGEASETVLRLEPGTGVEVRGLSDPFDGRDRLEGGATMRGELRSPKGGHLRLVYQPCDERRCLAPTALSITVPPATS
jgi:uncharacterized protein YyaL (SSP411 family)